jgi:hypothetical protein
MQDQFQQVNQHIDETNRSMQDQFQQVNQHIDETNRSMQDQFQQVNQHIDETNRSMQDQFQQVNQRIDESAESVVRRMEGSLGRFRGETYEKRCAEKIDAILVDHFGHAEVVDRAAINRQLAQARQDGVLSRQEYLDGRNADIIAHDTLADGTEQLWAVVEVSITFNRNDLETNRSMQDQFQQVNQPMPPAARLSWPMCSVCRLKPLWRPTALGRMKSTPSRSSWALP